MANVYSPSVKIDIDILMQNEKVERKNNNKLKCLETCIKILFHYLKNENLTELLNQMKILCMKKNQSGFVILGMMKFSVKMLIPKLEASGNIKTCYLETLAHIVHLLKLTKGNTDPSFETMRMNLLKSIEERNLDDIQFLILNFDYEPDDMGIERQKRISHMQKLSICSESEINSENTSKLGNKLDISTKEIATSSRGLKRISTTEVKSIEGDEVVGSNKSLRNDAINFSRRVNLPYIILAVDVTSTAKEMKKDVINEMRSINLFNSGEDKNEVITLEKRESNIFKKCLLCLFKFKRYSPTIIQCKIKYSDNKYERLIELRSISGNQNDFENLIILFIKSFSKKVKKIKVAKKSEKCFTNIHLVLKDFLIQEKIKQLNTLYGTNSPTGYSTLTDDEASIVDHSNREASHYYEIYRIISQENYDLGKSVSEFLGNFKEKYKYVEISAQLVPRPMEEIMTMIDDCVSTFHHYFNFGKSNTEQMLPYCRPAVEKFIFNKIYFLIYDIYNKKYEEENKKFLQQQNIIKVKFTVKEIMEYLEIKRQFRGIEIVDPKMSSNVLPYKSTIDCINKIEYEQSPKEKLDALLKASLEMRNSILGITGGKGELNSMDDELPLFIYITTQINVRNIVVELRLIEDYLKFSKNLDKESKVLTNLLVRIC